MKRQPLKSSAITSVGYDEATQRLHIEMASGQVYEYAGVDRGTYDGLLSAESPGQFFHQHIRGGGFVSARVEPISAKDLQ